jgi:inorganic triphosphatase YgiF
VAREDGALSEVELKFAVDTAGAAKLARTAALARPGRRKRLTSIYFDTEDATLAKHGMALRLRRSGRRWTQCLKAGGDAQAGLHSRDEWELDRPGPTLDLGLFGDTPLARLDGAKTLHTALKPVFAVDVMRTTWNVRPHPGQRVEVALDSGLVAAAGGARSDTISEVEIECVDAPPAAAYAVAERLLDEVALRPSATTKAERGYRLFQGEERRPAKAKRPVLEAGMTPERAARALVAAAIAQLQANEEGVLASSDPEFVHQARVALRRLRSTLRMFRRPVGKKRARIWRRALGDTARALGAARDWDVFTDETLPRLVRGLAAPATAKRLRQRAALAREDARDRARAALRSANYGRVLLDLSRWLSGEGAATGRETLDAFARRLIGKHHRRLAGRIDDLRALEAAERHRVRIEAKHLRYVADGMGAVFGASAVEDYCDALADMQDELGHANDAATALKLLETLDPPRAFAAAAAKRLQRRMQPGARVDAVAERIRRHGRLWGHQDEKKS